MIDWTTPKAYIVGMSGAETRVLERQARMSASAAYERHVQALSNRNKR